MSRRKLTTEEFIEKAKAVHGDRYDYSKVEYVHSKKDVMIICHKHGEFWQTPNDHLKKHGCKKCSESRKTKEDFIKESIAIHGGKYDYSKVEYVNTSTDVVIICPIHGEFPQKPCNHLAGNGCPECGKQKQGGKRSHEEHVAAIAKTNPNVEVLGKITGVSKKVLWRCKICGHVWPVRPCDLKDGNGCPKCSEHGFNDYKKGCVYLLVDDIELPTCIKIGVSNNFDKRLAEIVRHTPFPIHILKVFTFEAGCATFELEQFAHTIFADRNCHFEGFDGCTEWFWYSHEIVNFLEEYC